MIARLAVALAPLALGACTSRHQVAEYELHVRYVAETDCLMLAEVEHGIASNAPEPAVDGLRSVLAGRRVYPPEGGWISLDLDDLPTPVSDGEPAALRDLREFAGAVHVERSFLCVDEQGRLSLFRTTRVDHFRRQLEIVDAWWNRERAKDAPAPFAPTFPFLDRESNEMSRSAFASGHPWLSIDGDAVVLDVPMTSGNAARCLSVVAGAGGKVDPGLSQLLEQVTRLEVRDGHVRLAFGPEAPHVFRFPNTIRQPVANDGLPERVRSGHLEVADARALSVALLEFDRRAPK